MNRARIAAAFAAILTALLLQATLVGPLTMPLPVSLPALLVAAIALVDGPGAGIAFGFATGLIADLGSEHPAGVLALCWLCVGLVCGRLADRNAPLLRDVAIAAGTCAVASTVSPLLFALLDAGSSSLDSAVRQGILAALVYVPLALVIVALVRRFLRSETLRAPRPVMLVQDMR